MTLSHHASPTSTFALLLEQESEARAASTGGLTWFLPALWAGPGLRPRWAARSSGASQLPQPRSLHSGTTALVLVNEPLCSPRWGAQGWPTKSGAEGGQRFPKRTVTG